ncbi:DUF1302 family protein [uncultured Halovibrio sp.]|uniref:DUF1302 family protein n=1 Tax=uncultured Halovibrio sp. TaxID=985049 RepID=UPI0025D01C85|nr:DUF1302 family protein [uncultured Halovibrio sp.]
MSTYNKRGLVRKNVPRRLLLAGAIAAASAGVTTPVYAEEPNWLLKDWEISGYLRQYVGMNLENPTLIGPGPAIFDGTQEDDYKYDLSMLRSVGKLNLFRDFGDGTRFKFSGRISREVNTEYMRDMQRVADEWARTGPENEAFRDLKRDVYNDEEVRAAWLQMDLTDSTNLKLGRQQVVWGETDFFQLMDVVHGYDFRWRSFLEPENEELRKPLNIVNLRQRIADGDLQAIYIPGKLNDKEDFGNSYDVEGGRWANQPNRGVQFQSAPFGAGVRYNYEHPEADVEDGAYGLRWSSTLGNWGYSLAWFHGPNPNPVANPNPALNNTAPQLSTGAYEGIYEGPAGRAGEFIFPTIDVFGVTANNYFPALDVVFSTELAYIPEAPYNFGVESNGAAPPGEACGFFPGFCGIKEKNLFRSMFRIDKQLDLTDLIGTSRPSFASIQIFNNWITDYEGNDQLVNTAGFGGKTEEFSSILTAVLSANYANDTVNPSLAAVSDLTYGGGVIIPAVELVQGDHIRIRLEGNFFFHETDQDRPLEGFNDTNLFGYFSGNDQLMARLTYQF